MKHTPGPINLYHHKTSGGAEYLTDKFVICPNGDKEGIFEGAEYNIRLDGSPELSIRNGRLKEAAPELLEACQKIVNNWGNLHSKDRQQLKLAIKAATK